MSAITPRFLPMISCRIGYTLSYNREDNQLSGLPYCLVWFFILVSSMLPEIWLAKSYDPIMFSFIYRVTRRIIPPFPDAPQPSKSMIIFFHEYSREEEEMTSLLSSRVGIYIVQKESKTGQR